MTRLSINPFAPNRMRLPFFKDGGGDGGGGGGGFQGPNADGSAGNDGPGFGAGEGGFLGEEGGGSSGDFGIFGGYTGIGDMVDGGGPGMSGDTYGGANSNGAAADTNNDGHVSSSEASAVGGLSGGIDGDNDAGLFGGLFGGNDDATQSTSNTLRQTIANVITPNDEMSYIDGVLTSDDGSRVTENTGWQDLANVSTPLDGKSYSDGQLSEGTGIGFGDTFGDGGGDTLGVGSAGDGGNGDNPLSGLADVIEDDPGSVVVDTDEIIGEDTTTTATNTNTSTTGNNLADDLNAQIAALQAQIAALSGQTSTNTTVNNTSLPDDYLTEDALARYLADLDLGSNAYDPAAFLNAYGFAMDPSMMGQLIGTYQSDSGMYQRRAVKDKDTGEIRYVNVPIGAGAINGNNGVSQFRNERRTGFASFV